MYVCRWAAIASYLPQRTDNDIKNYWNTHLKKKLKKHQAIGAIFAPPPPSEPSSIIPTTASAGHVDLHHDMPLSKDYGSLHPAACTNTAEATHQLIARRSPFAATDGDSSSSSYASSMDNISRLLSGFMKSSPPQNDAAADIKPSATEINPLLSFNQYHMAGATTLSAFNDMLPSPPPPQQPALMGHSGYDEPRQQHQQGPLSPIEKWLFEEAAEQVTGLMDLSDGCCSVPMMF